MISVKKRAFHGLVAGLGLAATCCAGARAAERDVEVSPGGLIITPPSGIVRPEDQGTRARTTYKIFAPGGRAFASQPSGKFETPASLACVYGLTQPTAGCNPETLTTVASSGSKVVVIVDAYDYPTAQNDLSVYSSQFGLPPITSDNFQVVYAGGTKPPQDPTGGWELEEALDIEMAHALAPNAKVVLVEAQSNQNSGLLAAEKEATIIAKNAGGGEVSNSWCGAEFANEEHSERRFGGRNVVYFASAGDAPGTCWPSILANVVSVGGTAINRDSNGNFTDQTSWGSTGGGLSQYVPRPKYQDSVKNRVGNMRGSPDVALVASPATGVWVYDTTPTRGQVPNWVVLGGTSVASPAIAAIINSAGSFAKNTEHELKTVYHNRLNSGDWTDVTSGPCNNQKTGGTAKKGYDFCTGVGTPLGLGGK